MDIKELLAKKAELVAEVRSLADVAADSKQEWTSEHDTREAKVNEALDEVQGQIDAAERASRMAARASDLEDSMRETRMFGREDRRGTRGDTGEVTDATRATALRAWLRSNNGLEITDNDRECCERVGVRPNSPEMRFNLANTTPMDAVWYRAGRPMMETRALSLVSDAAGAAVVPMGFLAELERSMLSFDGVRQVARVIRTDTGNQIEMPTVDDTGNTGALLAEAATIGASVDPVFAIKLLDAFKFSSKPILVSAELLEDSAFNLGQIIPSLLGERLGRIQAAQFTTGTGSAQPNGVVTASTLGKTAASATAIATDEVIDLVHSVDPAYRIGGSVGFMMHDQVLKAVRKLKDTTNQYLWQPSNQMGVPDMLYGYPYTINQNMASAIATTAKTMLFGDFSKYYIRDVASVRLYRLEERYRDNDQTGFVAFMRSDGECINTAAIKHLVQA